MYQLVATTPQRESPRLAEAVVRGFNKKYDCCCLSVTFNSKTKSSSVAVTVFL